MTCVTPLFIDGVPVYVPYDGYVDLGRFTTYHLSRAVVEKGYASVLYGTNTLGGAINLVGRKPRAALEADGGIGIAGNRDANARDASWAYANLGVKRELGWLQLGVSSFSQDSYLMSGHFRPVAAEDGGERNNSHARDQKLNLKAAWTPNAQDEYTVNIVSQHGVKGMPPYAGSVAGVTPRYWQWPYWDKQSLYLLSKTHFGDKVLQLRAFYDEFSNSLFAYDDASYTTQRRASSFQSWYDDYGRGTSAQFDWPLHPDNTLGLAAHWKQDVHREHNAGEPVRVFKENTASIAAEDGHRFNSRWTAVVGVGRDRRATQQAQDYNSTTRAVTEFAHGKGDTTNAQALLRWRATDDWTLRASVARKSRFPTIKDRYSYRMGTALPNPDLNPERATHFKLGATGQLAPNWSVEVALFRSNIADLIQSVTVTAQCGANACLQAHNVGQARHQGVELGSQATLGAWTLDGHWQYLHRENLSNPAVLLTDSPRQQLRAHLGWQVADALTLHANARGSTQRYSSTTGTQVAGGFIVLDAKAVWRFSRQVSLEGGVHNLNDRLYAYSEGFYEPGRQVFVQVRMALN